MTTQVERSSVTPSPELKSYYVKTFGCQMNVADSERMSALMNERGLTEVTKPDKADVIIINGCTVREKAVHKAVSALGGYNLIKQRKNGRPLLGVGGCVGQLEKKSLFKNAPYLDFVFGTDAIDSLPEILFRVENGEKHLVYTDFDRSQDYTTETKVLGNKAMAYVNIMKGCDKYCTYCIVPFTRGKEKSRTIHEVIEDIVTLVEKGVREVTLLGQNVNSFGKGNPNTQNRIPLELNNIIGKVGPRAGEENFPQLLQALEKDPRLTKLKRIRFTSSHPLDFSDELIECYNPSSQLYVSKLTKNLHLPVQSGSNAVLQKMGRHHQIEGYIAQMDRLREVCPDIGLSTDLIVGFPTETEEQFEETITLLDRIQYDNIYAFAYSPRPGTRAAKLPDDIPAEEKNRRLNKLLQHQLVIAEKRYASRVGKVMEVLVVGEAKTQNLVEKRNLSLKDNPHLKVWTGHTTCNRVVNFVSDIPRNFSGQFVQLKIAEASSLSLVGELYREDIIGGIQ